MHLPELNISLFLWKVTKTPLWRHTRAAIRSLFNWYKLDPKIQSHLTSGKVAIENECTWLRPMAGVVREVCELSSISPD